MTIEAERAALPLTSLPAGWPHRLHPGTIAPVGRHRKVDDRPEFRLLFVCTGNICRSPFAEILTRHLLVGRLGGLAAAEFDVRSAGVQAVAGSAMYPASCEQLAPWNLDRAGERFVARQLRSAMILDSDLVLGASLRHRAAVVDRTPHALPVAFSLREFARLARNVDPALLPAPPAERAHALVELARAQRGLVPPGEDNVADPMGRSVDEHRRAAAEIRVAVETIVDIIAARAGRPG